MILLCLILVFIPFASVPGFIASSYTQPLPLFLGWVYLSISLNIKPSNKVSFFVLIFLIYITIFSVISTGRFPLEGPYQAVLIGYGAGFASFLLFLSLFRQALQNLGQGNPALANKIVIASRLTLFLVISTALMQPLPAFDRFLSYFKPRHVRLSEIANISDGFRGISGILPEPSYIGTTCALMLLVLFWLSFRISIQDNVVLCAQPLSRDGAPASSLLPKKVDESLLYKAYGTHCIAFLSTRVNQLLIISSTLCVIATFSPTSLISYILILLTVAIPLVLRLLFFKALLKTLMRNLAIALAFAGALLLFILLANAVWPASRLSRISDILMEKGLFAIVSNAGYSAADRSASSLAGLLSIFYYPLGLGLNGHATLFSNCKETLIVDYSLLCGSVFSSNRNHNAFATVVMDGGLIGILTIWLALGRDIMKVFTNNFGVFAWAGRLILSYLAMLFVVLPSPLGAPSAWLAIALILSCFSVSPDYGAFDSGSHP